MIQGLGESADGRLGVLGVRAAGIDVAEHTHVKAFAQQIADALRRTRLAETAHQAQLRVEHEDLTRLEAAYARLNPSADERAYLDRRLGDLETRARVRR